MRALFSFVLFAFLTLPAFSQGQGATVAASGDMLFVGESGNRVAPGVVYSFHRNDAGDWVDAGWLNGDEVENEDGFDLIDLDDPVLVGEHISTETSTDHNLYIRDNLMYQSNYVAGLRILDVSNPEEPVEVAFFDTVSNDRTGGGSWSNYPYFESRTIIVTSSREGLFMLKKREVDL